MKNRVEEGWGAEKVKRLSKGKKNLIDTGNSIVITRGKGPPGGKGELEEGKEGRNGNGRRLDLGW